MSRKKKIDESKIVKLYVHESLTGRKIAKITGHGERTIQKVLKKHRVKLRLGNLGKISTKKGKTYEEFYGTKRANEIKKKLIDSHLGIPSHRKGKSFEEEYGKKKAREMKKKISQKSKEQFSSIEAREAVSRRMKKYIDENPEWKELMRKQTTEYFRRNPHKGREHSVRMKRRLKDPKIRKEMSDKAKKYYRENPDALKRMSYNMRKIWGTPEKRKYARERRLKQKFPYKHTLPEKLVFDEMQLRGIKFEKHKTVLNICQPDAVINNKKIAIFVDGDYWHAHPEKYKDKKLTKAQIDKVRRDKEQNKMLKKDNWIILRFWESSIKKDVAKCIDKIVEARKLKRL